MGNRLHYHKKHDIEYAGAHFNWGQEEVYQFLCEHDCTVWADNTDDSCYATEFSVDFDDIKNLIEDLEKMPPEKVVMTIDGAKYTALKVLEFFREAYENAPKNNSDIYFSWY